jgi:hypothetical protein
MRKGRAVVATNSWEKSRAAGWARLEYLLLVAVSQPGQESEQELEVEGDAAHPVSVPAPCPVARQPCNG